MSRLSKSEKVILDEFYNSKSIELYNKQYNELGFNEIHRVNQYIHDIAHPQWKMISIDKINTGYYISNTGKILDPNGKYVKLYKNTSGYLATWLKYKADNVQYSKNVSIHRLVAQVFISNPDNKPEVNHINFNPECNWVGNLEWMTHKENINYSIASGHQVVGSIHKNAKCTDQQIHEVCKLLESNNMTIKKISDITGVPIKTIQHIRFDNGWKHISSNYNIIKDKRKQGPKFSEISNFIMELIKDGKSNSEIYRLIEINKYGENINKKSIHDMVYHNRKSYNQSITSTTIDQLGHTRKYGAN